MILILLAVATATAPTSAVQSLWSGYQAGGASSFDAARGKAMWTKASTAGDGSSRSCASCHGEDLRAGGRHKTTGEDIAPMAPSVNPDRLTDTAFIEKWFGRNCKWTYGRECTPQEKGDFLQFLLQ